MPNLKIELFLEQIDFGSSDFKTEIRSLKSFEIQNATFGEEIIDDIHHRVMSIKGDWVSISKKRYGLIYSIDVHIIFHSLILDNQENEIVDRVIQSIEGYVEEIEIEKKIIYSDQFSTSNEDGLILKVSEIEEWGIAQELKDFLNSDNIEFEVIYHRQSRFDGGASGGSEEILIYIANWAISGITWDIFKGSLMHVFGTRLQHVKTSKFENYKFNKLRKTVSERVIEDPKDLVLTDFQKQDEEIIIIFSTNGINSKSILVVCDLDYQIKELTLERV
ncbi:hypothetical protein AMS62_19840 [Bacillus sp. FJAT-18019]|nr:hypothetical protein AMS62_19840 [Bacillus sp. FJAT-18019]